MKTQCTPGGVRLRLYDRREGGINWLLLPGGPGSDLEGLLRGLVWVDTPPDCSWHPEYVRMTNRDPPPAFEQAAVEYARDKTVENLKVLAVSSAQLSKGLGGREIRNLERDDASHIRGGPCGSRVRIERICPKMS
jgi:hypothetical protein